MIGKTLGILELENKPMEHPGALSAPGTFPFPVRRLTVPGATTRNVVDGDPSVKDAYIRSARQLEDEGVAAIIANCGFSAVFQAEVSAAVSVPVALSSLLLVPLVAKTLPPGRKVGIVTYDASKLKEDHFRAAGWSSREIDVAIAGIEGSESWHQFAKPVPVIPQALLINDVMAAATSLIKTEPDVAALVFECAGFPLTAEPVRIGTGLPVADYVSLAKMIIEMSPPVS
ncbi:aspartate/glutamate racemase family protein [Rhizobium sp. 1AS11]|uniref:aspartate/glutamate racemase family protein n=1 Tax=Rhizobium acaciae TaxID=2989736 RepID=UPI002221F34B|nr:aspartate/glutamate racemase family protein [Rhizobium acaciae]MCW1413820.1 aspartate/glutamate racemase family protein [Rhizobium acaciae]MCW1745957.1 aspartate/glutamate racemase family protein [Rhizobium acaciae]